MGTKIRILLTLNFSCNLLFLTPGLAYSDTDSIIYGKPLKDFEHLNSANKVFRLQFFNPGAPENWYLGIFYNAPPGTKYQAYELDRKPVWVANRNRPIPDASRSLMIDSDGRLTITYVGGSPIVLNSGRLSASNLRATLLDSGNLVLREQNPDGSVKQVVWQSFDYPTDTLLPGMKLGINFTTGHNWSLTSWVNDQVPASGTFTIGGDPNRTSQLVIWYQGEVFWTSGHWNNGCSGQVSTEVLSPVLLGLNTCVRRTLVSVIPATQ